MPSSNLTNTRHNTADTNDDETGHADSADCAANAAYDTDNDTVDGFDDDNNYYQSYYSDDDNND